MTGDSCFICKDKTNDYYEEVDGLIKSIHKKVEISIKRYGRQIIGVVERTPFVYTIGNHTKKLPELLFIGLCDGKAQRLLNMLSDIMLQKGEGFMDGERVSIGGLFPLMIREIPTTRPEARDDYTIQVGQFYGTEDYRLQQVIAPDKNGRYPGEEGCDENFARIPLL